MSFHFKTWRMVILGIAFSTIPAGRSSAAEMRSATHFGMAVEDRSSTGFDRSVGSAVFLDGSFRLAPRFDLGWRTLAFGGTSDQGEFFRLGVGPLLTGMITESWSVEACPFVFQESARGTDGEPGYTSKGSAVLMGWHRRMALSERIDLSWGGFISWHSGSFSHSTSSGSQPANTAQTQWSDVSRNQGGSRGIELALRVRL